MRKHEYIEKWAVTLLLLVCWVTLPLVGYQQGGWGHLTYSLCHANVWHLAGNLFVMWVLPSVGWRRMILAYLIAVLCSYGPFMPTVFDIVTGHPDANNITVGFSGVLFAIIGIRWGAWSRKVIGKGWKLFLKRVMPIVLLGAFLPHIDWCLHLYCVLTGLAYGYSRG